MAIRANTLFTAEVKDLLLADLALAVAFDFALNNGVQYIGSTYAQLLLFFPIAVVAVSFTFILHELMHKFTAQHFGAMAAFRKSDSGLLITLVSGLFGFVLGIPGATMIYAQSMTRREEGIISVAGPLTNLVVFAAFFAMAAFLTANGYGSDNYLVQMANVTMYVSIILAFFNMLPVFPLDGSKVLKWNKAVYAAVLVGIFLPLLFVSSLSSLLFGLAFMMAVALILGVFYRGSFF